jgi:hypothetical protein
LRDVTGEQGGGCKNPLCSASVTLRDRFLALLTPGSEREGRAGREVIRYGGSGPFPWLSWGRFWGGMQADLCFLVGTERRDLCRQMWPREVRSGSIRGTAGELRAMPLDSRVISCAPCQSS